MNLYLDTSSFLKLFFNEEHSEKVRQWIDDAALVSVSRIGYPEAMSAVERRFRAGDLTREDRGRTIRRITEDWNTVLAVDFDEKEAARLALKHGLRALDALHLASARLLTAEESEDGVAFSSFDVRLNQAARAEGFHVLTAGR